MAKAYSFLVVAGLICAAGQAAAGCAERIDKAYEHPAIVSGEKIKDEKGSTEYQAGGPASPRENWFGSKPQLSAVLSNLSKAKTAIEKGDKSTCNEKMDQVETVLAKVDEKKRMEQ